jgi:hydroxyethylthiazole kinase-like sugar kinase family protein
MQHDATIRGAASEILSLQRQVMRSGIDQALRIEKPDLLQASGVWVSTFTEAGHWI